jgi:hypothetical protein
MRAVLLIAAVPVFTPGGAAVAQETSPRIARYALDMSFEPAQTRIDNRADITFAREEWP